MAQVTPSKTSTPDREMHWALRAVVRAVIGAFITPIIGYYFKVPYLSAAVSWVCVRFVELLDWLGEDTALQRLQVLSAVAVGCALATLAFWLWRRLVASEAKNAEREGPQSLVLDADQLAVLRVIGMHVERNAHLRFDIVVRRTGLTRIATQAALTALRENDLIPLGQWTDELASLTNAGNTYILQSGLLVTSEL
ncbi:hypothetical protein PS862_00820 [Pseudomonas fluorescens]|uniref:Uncharacterized protein n=1 Tax=Pseudomonas fluorescens TaxID=294 RepID=A0A5E7HA28_PSEFL|nr:hypothetical protein [Pseudomonas fluorescens]VVO61061.1 hypothetical protein PS862_00820 [Pseudomonas fluorescens]